MPAQTYKNHTRFDPKFHFFLIPLCLVCFIMSIFHVVHQNTPTNMLLVPVTFAVLFLALVSRLYSIKVQDRVIRLEENVRLGSLGVDLSGLTLKQIIALRFASNEEAAALAARATKENLDPKAIKAAVVNWRADLDRV